MKFQAQRGTEDVLSAQAGKWRHVESAWLELTHLYSYGEIRTPTFEDTQLFIRTSGETSDIVSKEMYTFRDQGGRSITLKPEGTAPAMRAVVEHSLCPPGTVLRLAYVTPFFRYGRPQKGRLREAHQLGLELVGANSAHADAEVLEVVSRFFAKIGIPDSVILLNSIGRTECRERYRAAILEHIAPWLAEQTTDEQEKAQKNPMRLLDSKDEKVHAVLAGLAPVTDFLEDDSKQRFETIQELLTEAGVKYRLAPEIVRGLDYYTETVFEVQSDKLGAQSSLCGGGRYDNLIGEIGGAATPSVGVGIGVERVLLALEAYEIAIQDSKPVAFVVSAGQDAAARNLVRELRDAGIATDWDIESRSMKSQMRQADKSGARFALVIGDTEVQESAVQVKELAKSEQFLLPRAEVVKWLQERA
jgi:histidyl-tRNA synthetase